MSSVESQLAWTPVSAGLPTEPGRYLFVDITPRWLRKADVLTLRSDGWSAHPSNWDYTHYRRIELPEAV